MKFLICQKKKINKRWGIAFLYRNCWLVWKVLLSFLFCFSLYFYRSGISLNVLKMDIDYLGLTSLQRISNGKVLIALNTRLCYMHNLDMSPIFTNPIQTLVKKLNRNNSECGKCGRGLPWQLFILLVTFTLHKMVPFPVVRLHVKNTYCFFYLLFFFLLTDFFFKFLIFF